MVVHQTFYIDLIDGLFANAKLAMSFRHLWAQSGRRLRVTLSAPTICARERPLSGRSGRWIGGGQRPLCCGWDQNAFLVLWNRPNSRHYGE